MLDLRRLNTFREVAERRSFSAAAAALDYTQSSVSEQISTLERALGATLIDRASRPIRPTAIGAAVLAQAEPVLGQAASLERELAAIAGGESGTVRMAGFFTAWTTFLPGAVAAFSRARPGVQLELRQLEPEPALRGLRSGELDLAVVYRHAPPDDEPGIEAIHLLDDPYAVALPAGHRLARRKRVRIGELANERWVSPPATDPYARVLRDLCLREGGFEPDVVYETADIAMAQPLVAAGLTVAMLPALGLVPRQAGVAVRPLLETTAARSVWVMRRPGRRAPAAAAMVDALVAVASRPYRADGG